MSDEDLRDFFPLPKVVEGIFKLFEELFNVKFQQIEGDFPKWHEDLTLFAVQDAKSGQTLGHFYFDPFIRDEKGYAGADKGWYVPIKTRSKVGPSLPLGAIVMALPPPNYGKPSLLNFSEAKEVLRNFGGLLQHVLVRIVYKIFPPLVKDSKFFSFFRLKTSILTLVAPLVWRVTSLDLRLNSYLNGNDILREINFSVD